MGKSNLLRLKKTLLSILLSITTLSTTACSTNDNENVSTEISTESSNESIKELENKSEEIKKVDNKTLESTFAVDERTTDEIELERKEMIIDNYLNYFEGYETTHYLENYYITEEEVQEVIDAANNDVQCKYVFDNNIEKIIEKIENNSIEFIKNNKQCTSAFITSDSEINLFLDQIDFEQCLECILKNNIENSSNNINEDMHQIESLKIVFDDSQSSDDELGVVLGYYDPELDLVVLYRNAIRKSAEDEKIIFSDKMTHTIQHELNHARQDKCHCRINEETLYQSIDYNTDNISTIMESSAESEIYNLDKNLCFDNFSNFDYTYIFEREDESLLLLLALFNENKTLEDYYNAIYDADVNALLDFFDMHTKEEIYEFYKILYIMDGINGRSDLVYKYYTAEERENLNGSDVKQKVGYGYRLDIFRITLTRLIEYTNVHNDFSLIDNLMLFNIIKNKIVEGCYISEKMQETDDYTRIYDENFVKELNELENEYIKFLSEYYQVEINEIRQLESDEIFSYGIDIFLGTGLYDADSTILRAKFPILEAIIFIENNYFSDYNFYLKQENVQKILTLE